MKVAIISDLHGFLPELPDVVDLLIIAGDVCPVQDHSEERQCLWLGDEFGPWLADQPAHRIVGVAGNHDFALEKFSFPNLPWTYLQNKSTEVEGLKVWGTPLSGKFGKWAFMRDESDLQQTYVAIPGDVDIVISHGPPKWYGDQCQNGYHAGSPSLYQRLCELEPLLTVVGHIHESRGIFLTEDAGVVINSSAVDLNYRLRPDPYTYVYI
jgi:Icc-related predicted phosphoesterase